MKIFLKVCLIVLPICNSNIFSASESSTDPIEKSPSRSEEPLGIVVASVVPELQTRTVPVDVQVVIP